MNLDISYYVSVFLRRIYVMILVAVGVTAAAVYLAMELPPTYRADARLLVEAPQIPTNLASSTVEVETSEQLQIIQQRLMSRENLLQIAREMDVFPGMEGMTADAIVDEMRANTRINRSSGRSQATLMTIGFLNRDAERAAAVVNEYTTRILSENRSIRTELAEQTLEFFEQEVERLSEELARQSERIVEFKRANSDALPQSLGFREDRRTSLRERVNQIDRELVLLDEQETRLQEVFESGASTDPDADASPETRQLARLREDLDTALALLSPSNPRVRILEAQIRQAEAKLLAASAADDAEAAADPRRAMLDSQLADIADRRQALKEQLVFIENEIERLTDSIERTPEVAIAIESLERDYQNVQGQYDQAANRLATAAQGERIELLSKGERISVIESATVPAKPTSPNRPLIAGAGAVIGVGLGSALIFLLEFLNQAIRRPVDLERQLGVTPIATLPYIRTRREIIWKRLLLVALLALVIIGGPAIIYSVHTFLMPIDLIVDRIVSEFS
jgi:polysaccharide chain length determinant protein (PEP-CTERM system associated)